MDYAVVMLRWTVVIASLTGCASSTAPAVTADPVGPPSEGQKCLADARAEREPGADAPTRIEVRHILIRHAELADPRGATRSPEQACLRALQALEELEGGAGWDEVSDKYNDSKNDSLGRVSADDLTPEFANAAFALEENQLSYVVETDRGFHIILRE